ncbi:hypothetical protein JVT61DRAFT_5750 [Boletus reticuloceps]|uniref:Uncharacterized protein n=1 Tax=Boletus reticuloceps TaxID=495285 RepID=A0A8I2YZ10_9AGAM|nr:hypothetical protein JVT61DRAFT_5750 [Boletus reticuloceps]
MSLHVPPYYILVSLQHNSPNQSNALVHADIEYRYADDSPLSLLSHFPDEHVLVFNYDPAAPAKPTISSTSSQLALSGVKVLPAPGARVDEDASKNDNMYILEVTSTSDDQYARQSWCSSSCSILARTGSGVESSQTYLQNPKAIITRFKQSNADLRRILEYPSAPTVDHLSEPHPQPEFPFHIAR